ncbi:glycosyltransferase family 4 protein [Alcaligenes sp. NLF5-7]|uniref:glycosyltransferase family 4 protein n=1 Tax=Alcaligenes sp. NLF5-7 TaxID=2918755 RepID=UPI0020C496C2|nr:glycosyltransferase family 4 protein [Alcaligenes sp. NLF5-7]UTM03651.1 glycosyltransferase family 4 protein [Alcaligenes sp. NLF5-7]
MNNSSKLVSDAYNKYKNGDFQGALELYQEVSGFLGEEFFKVNIYFCKKKLQEISDYRKEEPDPAIADLVETLATLNNGWVSDRVEKYKGCRSADEKILFDFWTAASSGYVAALSFFKSNIASRDSVKELLSLDLVESQKWLKENNKNEYIFSVLKCAYSIHGNEKVLRSLFWAALKIGQYEIAKNAVNLISKIGKKRLSTAEWLEKAREKISESSGAYDLIKSKLSKTGDKSYTPVSKKIAYFLHNSLPYSSGGYATRGHGLAVALTELGYNVVCASRPGYPFDIPGDHEGKILPSEDVIDGLRYLRIFDPSRKGLSAVDYMLSASEKIVDFLKEHRIEIVVAASNHLNAIPAAIAAKQVGIPFIYEVRGFWEITRLSREPDFKNTRLYVTQIENEKLAATYADDVFTLTSPMRDELIKRGISHNKITILPNSCDPKKFSPRGRDRELAAKLGIPDDVPVIGYIGSFVQYEGLDNLAQACALLVKENIDFRLLLVGNENASGSERGPITAEILRVAAEEGLTEKLIMPGRIPHEQVEAYYSLIDIAPFPRKPQPVTEMVSPMKPLEALAMQKAILVSSVQALREMVIENKTGLVFEKGNIEDLAEKLKILINNDELRKKLGVNGRAWVEDQRTWAKTAEIAQNILTKYHRFDS